jgi:hypothetical protein
MTSKKGDVRPGSKMPVQMHNGKLVHLYLDFCTALYLSCQTCQLLAGVWRGTSVGTVMSTFCRRGLDFLAVKTVATLNRLFPDPAQTALEVSPRAFYSHLFVNCEGASIVVSVRRRRLAAGMLLRPKIIRYGLQHGSRNLHEL